MDVRRLAATIAAVASLGAAGSAANTNWPGFRGPGARGIADGHALPVSWNVKAGENVRFSTRVPGSGHASPIVWADRVYLTTAVADGAPPLKLGDSGGIGLEADDRPYRWQVLALDARSGAVAWTRDVHSGKPRAKRHVKSSQANATPVTDGRAIAAVLGSEGLHVFEMDGRPRWSVDLGKLDPGLFGDPTSEWGHASSPVLFEDRVIVQVDRHAGSLLAAYDVRTGREAWKVARDERPVWATPTLVSVGGHPELVVVGGYHVRGYDPKTGRELWRFADDAQVKTPTPFEADGLLIFAGGYRGRPMYALKPGGRGDLSVPESAPASGALAWRTERGGPYTSTPVAYRGVLYGVRDEGVMVAHDMKTGTRLFQERTGTSHSASLLASDGHVYAFGETGEALVLKASRAFEVLARNDMGDTVMATPAIAHGTLYVRTGGGLVAISARPR
jgi:outer membrane protein assembly factor BamB